MRVLVTASSPWWNACAQGAVMQALALQNLGHRVLLLVSPSGPGEDMALKAGVARVAARRLPSMPRIARGFRADVICAHRAEDQAAGVLLLPRIPLVRVRNDQRKAGGGFLWKLVDRRTRLVVFPSRFMADRGFQGPRKGPVEVIPLPVDTERFTPTRGEREKLVVSLGRLSPIKGHRTLIRAMADIPGEWRAVIAGEEAQQTIRELTDFASSVGARGKVEFPGRVDDVRSLLARASVGVVTSLGSEVVSRAGLEIMSSGLPLLAAATNGLCDLVRDGETGLFHSPGNHRQLARQIRHLAENPEVGEYLGGRGRDYVCRECSLPAVGRKWEHALTRECITGRPATGKA